MRAVTGSISSSKPISLSKAAAILSKFAAADTGAGRDLAAHLRRASNAFNDLVERHRELRVGRRKGGDENPVKGEADRTGGDLGELEEEKENGVRAIDGRIEEKAKDRDYKKRKHLDSVKEDEAGEVDDPSERHKRKKRKRRKSETED